MGNAMSKKLVIQKREVNALYINNTENGNVLRIQIFNPEVLRVSFSSDGEFDKRQGEDYLNAKENVKWDHVQDDNKIILKTDKMEAVIDKYSGAISFFDNKGNLFLKESEKNQRVLEQVKLYKTLDTKDLKVQEIRTADGLKKKVMTAEKVFDKTVYRTRNYFEFDEGEMLVGFGQGAHGEWNLRHSTYYINQANRKIAMPMAVSDKGYGILLSTKSPAFFAEDEDAAYIQTEADFYLDYYFVGGDSLFDVIRNYRRITGKAAMLPKWCYGYIQSKERYKSQGEILEVASEFRKRGIGLDCIVLDWMSWEDGMWGQKSFDPERFPDPTEMVNKLHDHNVHFMISIWPNMSPNTRDNQAFKKKGLLLTGTDIYNAFDEDARKLYWSQVEQNLYCHGIDAWWCDSSEPITPEWEKKEEPSEDAAYEEFCRDAFNIMPGEMANAYALYHGRTIWEGIRNNSLEKRVVNLTRSGWAGSQKYGTILWSGDISASWQCLENQIKAALQFAASGMPYWTLDVGAFFVKRGQPWFWDGQYENGIDDNYKKLYVRWLEFAAFLPVFRAHGTDIPREPWAFGDSGDVIYEAIVKTIRMRYSLLPYLYTLGAKACLDDGMIIRPLFFEFAGDKVCNHITDQFMLGPSLMVCPLVSAEDERKVYLPAGQRWYDFYSREVFEGGKWIHYKSPIERIPVFVPEGSIIPVEPGGRGYRFTNNETEGRGCWFASEEMTDHGTVSYEVFPGKDCEYELYEDSGDGYGYENGDYRITRVAWDEETQELRVISDNT